METSKVHQDLIGKNYNEIKEALNVVEDQGDCCGYASCDSTSVIPEGVDVDKLSLKDCVSITYDDEYSNRAVLNFVFTDGEGELILGYELSAGSGSGWSYGSYVKLCLGERELASASW